MRSFELCGVRIDAVSLQEAVGIITTQSLPGAVHLCNAYTLALASRDADLRNALNRGALNLADGMPLVWLARWLGFPEVQGRVYGPELFELCLAAGASSGLRHYLYGGSPTTMQRLVDVISRRWPGAHVVGFESPPVLALDELNVAGSLNAMGTANLVWVALGTPKQDHAVDELAARGSKTYIAIGAAFDFVAGTTRQAPKWLRDRGLEWAFRLLTEPRRLWRRYLFGNLVFLWCVLRGRSWMPCRPDAYGSSSVEMRDDMTTRPVTREQGCSS